VDVRLEQVNSFVYLSRAINAAKTKTVTNTEDTLEIEVDVRWM